MKIQCDCSPSVCEKWHPKIEALLREAASQARNEKRELRVDMTSLAKNLKVSRPTLYRHTPFIEGLLRRLDVERRRVDGDAARVALSEKIERLEHKYDIAEKEIEALRRCMSQIFQTLALNASPIAKLVEAQLSYSPIIGQDLA